MRLVILLLLLASAAAAQAPLFPNGAGSLQTAAPHWRVAGSGGFAVSNEAAAVSVSVERSVAGPLAVGGRGVMYVEGGFQDDGGSVEGGALDVIGSVSTRDRILDVRVFAGVGVSVVERSSGGFAKGRAVSTEEGLFGPHLVAGAGLDLYPLAGVGVGVEARGVAAPVFGTSLSTVAIGLRVRLAR